MWYYNKDLIERTTGISLADHNTDSSSDLRLATPLTPMTLSIRMDLPFVWAITIPHDPYTTQIDLSEHVLYGDSAIGMLSSFNRELRSQWRKQVAYRYY